MNFEQPKQEKAETICGLCGANHQIGDCEKLMNFSSLDEGVRQGVVDKLEKTIEKSGILKLEDKGIQAVLNQFTGEDKQAIIEKLAVYYNLGEFVEIKEKDDKTRKDFKPNRIRMNVPGVGVAESFIDKKPFGFDRDFKTNVLRHHRIKEGGEIDPVVRVSPITSLLYIDIEESK